MDRLELEKQDGEKSCFFIKLWFWIFSFSGINSSMGIKGSERGWSNCHPGLYADIIKREKLEILLF